MSWLNLRTRSNTCIAVDKLIRRIKSQNNVLSSFWKQRVTERQFSFTNCQFNQMLQRTLHIRYYSFQSLPSTYKNPGQWYEMLQIISQEVFMSSFFLFNWRILWTYWWQRHVNLLWFYSYLFYYFMQYFNIPYIVLNYASCN
jgi:hypothetical protein